MSATPTRRLPWLRATAAVTVLTLALAGCGSDDDGTSGEESQEQADSAEEPDTTGPDGDAEDGDADENAADPEDTEQDQEAPDDGTGQDDGSTSGEPAFLDADDFPAPGEGEQWEPRDTTSGGPQDYRFCVDELIPQDGTWTRTFGEEWGGTAEQVVVDAGDDAAATELMEQLTQAAAGCAETWETQNDGTAEINDHGPRTGGDATHAYTMAVAAEQAGKSASVIGFGRTGSTVTYVYVGQMGTLEDHPVGTVDGALSTALDRLGG